MTSERWAPVVGFEGHYEVSDHGRVRSVDHVVPSKAESTRTSPGKTLTPWVADGGYLRLMLCRPGTRQWATVGPLVLEAFVAPRPEGLECCHTDGDPANNALGNLRWDTGSGNQQDCLRHGRHSNASKTHCPQGHPYDEANTQRNRHGRRCRACGRERRRNRADRGLAPRDRRRVA